jgi:hypothetical protein
VHLIYSDGYSDLSKFYRLEPSHDEFFNHEYFKFNCAKEIYEFSFFLLHKFIQENYLDFVIEFIKEDLPNNPREPKCAHICTVSGQKRLNEYAISLVIEAP